MLPASKSESATRQHQVNNNYDKMWQQNLTGWYKLYFLGMGLKSMGSQESG